jgi:hypothetical protein
VQPLAQHAWLEVLLHQVTTNLFDRMPLAWPKAVQWAQRDEPWVRRAGFTLMAGLAAHDKGAPTAPS